MEQQTRDIDYTGSDRTTSERLYREDAARAAAAGWLPLYSQWSGDTLQVRYRYSDDTDGQPSVEHVPDAKAMDPLAETGSRGSGRSYRSCGGILAIGTVIVIGLLALGAVLDITDPGWRERQDEERAAEEAAENRAWCAKDDSTVLDGDKYFERCTSTCNQVQDEWERFGSLAASSDWFYDWEVSKVWRAAEKRAEELGCSTLQWQVVWGLGG